MPSYMRWKDGITEDVTKKAEKELGEMPETKRKSLEQIRNLINSEEGFCPLMEDWFLIIFLRNKKFNVNRAFKTLKKFYEFKSMYSGTITDLRPTRLKNILEMDTFVISPFRNANGEAVMIFFLGSFDFGRATTFDLLAASFACAEIAVRQEVTQVCGTALIFDFKNASLRFISHLATPSFVSLADRWPYRTNSFHVVNQPSYFNMLYDIIKIFLSKKLRKRVIIHGNNLDSLHDFIPQEILPKKLEGYLSDDIYKEFRDHLYSNESIFDVITKYTYNGISYGKNEA